MISRTKSKSVWLAAGKPTSILEAHPDQQVEHLALAGRRHRVDQRLVAVTQVDRAPQRRGGDAFVGPRAIGYRDLFDQLVERPVAVDRHGAAALGVPDRLVGRRGTGRRADLAELVHGGELLLTGMTTRPAAALNSATGGRSGSDPVTAAKQEGVETHGRSVTAIAGS
jgi:hypothetical protein